MMFETKLSLIVPVDFNIRDEIRKKVEQYFAKNNTVPPVSMTMLSEMADTLIGKYEWKKSHKAFVMVCCGNAIWRTVAGTVSFNRRMLLLPQCLSNSNQCKAQHDEFGLLCSECGGCEISNFLRAAESLGYITAVTEGTTIATRLVESGKVDAIIGVGCMEVLQKMFAAVNKYSVPAIGVPLLTCGCIDTKADADWIMEEIHYINQKSEFRLLNLNNLQQKTTALFTETNIKESLELSGLTTDKMILDTILAGGKRVRPLLTVLSYEAFCNQPDENVLRKIALSIECFHKASLIHDDIEDNDSTRYGKDTAHAQYGIPVAINLGDLLIGEGYRLIAETNLEPEVITSCLKIISQGHKDLSIGQGVELLARYNKEVLSVDDMLNVFKNKTGAAFKVALLLGAVASAASQEVLKQLNDFSNLLGIAYQLKDDLEEYSPEEGFISFENPSVLISMLFKTISGEDRVHINNILTNNNLSTIETLMEKYSIHKLTSDLLRDYISQIYTCMGNFQNLGLKLALHEIVGKIFKDYI